MTGDKELSGELTRPLVELLLSIADDKFILGHRNADWTGLAPILEEDIAFSALAQDEISHATALYELICQIRRGSQAANAGENADQLAYGRRAEEYRCAGLVELHDEFDWAFALARQFACAHFDWLRLERLSRSNYKPLADLCGRLLAEQKIHIEHADSWVARLGRAGEEPRSRMQAALDRLATTAPMLAEPPEGVAALEQAGVYPRGERDLFDEWAARLTSGATQGGLRLVLSRPPASARGGRHGVRSDGFAEMLAEMTEVYRVEPEAAW